MDSYDPDTPRLLFGIGLTEQHDGCAGFGLEQPFHARRRYRLMRRHVDRLSDRPSVGSERAICAGSAGLEQSQRDERDDVPGADVPTNEDQALS